MVMSYHTTARTYKLLSVQTQEGLNYLCLRLYNNTGRFIKQFLFEAELVAWLRSALPFPEGSLSE